jgi:hypothetical protein
VTSLLPARFRYTGNLSLKRKLAETDAAQRKLSQEAAGPPATLTPIAMPYGELRRLAVGVRLLNSGGLFFFFCDLRGCCHLSILFNAQDG